MRKGFGEATVSSDLLGLLLRSVAAGAASLGPLLEAAGVDPALLQGSDERISADQFQLLWDELERGSDDRCFGLHLGELDHGLPAGHVLFAVMLNSPSVGQALQRYCRYHGIMADVVQPRFALGEGGARITLQTALTLHHQHVDCIFSLVASVVRQLAGGRFEGRVRLTRPRPDAAPVLAEYQRLFGADVQFGAPGDALVVAGALLEAPIPSADPELLELLEPYARRVAARVAPKHEWTARVEQALRTTLCDGKPSLAQIAKKLAISTRSLQGKLRAEGTSYQQTLDRLREEMATFYLRESQMPILDLAFLLGYADQSAFNHSFKKWTGTSPTRYRADGLEEPSNSS